MGYEYDFSGAFDSATAGAMGIAVGIVLVVYFLAMGFSLVMYVLNAVGIYRIAKRRGIHHPWLAWVPIGGSWVLGSIADQYQYVVNQKKTSRRKILLILSLVMIVACMPLMCGAALLMINSDAEGASFALGIALLVLSYLATMGLVITVTVFSYIAYYDLFRSCKPGKEILFLVLGIIFNVTLPFFVFFCGNSDGGMQERRRTAPVSQISEQPADEEPVYEGPVYEEPVETEEIPVVETDLVDGFE